MSNKISFIDQNVLRIIINWTHKSFLFYVVLLIFFSDRSFIGKNTPPTFALIRWTQLKISENVFPFFSSLHYENILKSLCHLIARLKIKIFSMEEIFQKVYSSKFHDRLAFAWTLPLTESFSAGINKKGLLFSFLAYDITILKEKAWTT